MNTKSYDHLVAENAALLDEVAALRSRAASARSTEVALVAEIARLRKPKVPPRKLDKNAADAFQRPAYSSR